MVCSQGGSVDASDRLTLDVSVIMPAFNRSSLIVRALESIRMQARPPKELIVVDDASSDDTVEQVRAWSERSGFPVTIERMPVNGGPAVARNRGIELATTTYVAFLDSDDEHLPGTLEKLVQALEQHLDAVVAFGDATRVSTTGTVPNAMFIQRIDVDATVESTAPGASTWWLRDAKSTMLRASLIPTCSSCFRRADALAIGGMPTAYRAGEDWLFWLKLSERGRFICYLEDLSIVHRHAHNLTHPSAAADASRQKVIGFRALLDGSAGIALTDVQRGRVEVMIQQRIHMMRYQASRLGLGAYFRHMRGIPDYTAARFVLDSVRYPKTTLRATLGSCGMLRPPRPD